MRRPSKQSELIAVPLGSDIETHRPEKARFPCIFVPCRFASFGSESAQTDQSRGPDPSNRSFGGMRRPSNQSESIAVPLGSDIGTHRPEKPHFPCIFVPGCYFLQWKCAQTDHSRGPNSSKRSFKGMRRRSNQSESIAVPLGSDIGTHRPEKAHFPVFLYLVATFCNGNMLLRTTAVAPTLRIDLSEL